MSSIEAFILAGGLSRRMGADKARLRIGEQTFTERIASALDPIAKGRIAIVGGDHTREETSSIICDLRVIEDVYGREVSSDKKVSSDKARDKGDLRSPLIGIHAALTHADARWVAIVACDLPFVSGELLTRLASLREDSEGVGTAKFLRAFDAVVPIQADGRAQPLCALYRRESCLPQITTLLDAGELSARALLNRIHTRFVSFEELADLEDAKHLFTNVNTPAEYKKALSAIKLMSKSKLNSSEKGSAYKSARR